jgi:hypothetical protein
MRKRKKYGSILLLSFVAGLATYAVLFHPSWCSHSKLKDAVMQISPQDLLAVSDKSETLFDREYLSKVLSVHGIIKKIKKNEGEHYTLYLGNDPATGPSVSCSLDSLYNHSRLPFKPGDGVTLRGTCAGRLMDIMLIQCVIEK